VIDNEEHSKLEVRDAHTALDTAGVPRDCPEDGAPLSVGGRVREQAAHFKRIAGELRGIADEVHETGRTDLSSRLMAAARDVEKMGQP